MVRSYNAVQVYALCDNYLEFRSSLFGGSQNVMDTSVVYSEPVYTERAFGQEKGTSWPFMTPSHAKPKIDGKRKANAVNDMWIACMDLERGLTKLSDGDLSLIYRALILKTRTVDELARELNTKKASVNGRVLRAVDRLTLAMDGYAITV